MREIVSEVIVAEHDVSHLSAFKLGRSEMIQHFGKGVSSYFVFVQFIAFVNFLMFLMSMLFIFSEAIRQSKLEWSYFVFLTPTFSGNYVYITLVSIFLLTCILLWYRAAVNSERMTAGAAGAGGVVSEISEGDAGQEIIGNDDIVSSFCKLKQKLGSPALSIFRFILSVCFIGLFFAYYYCQKSLQIWALNTLAITIRQTLMSLFFVFIDATWRLSCGLITSLESHKYLSTYQKSGCIKSFISRVIMFTIWAFVIHSIKVSLNEPTQMINLLLVNAIVSPLIDVFSIWLYNKCCFFICCGSNSTMADGQFKHKFNLADEYTQVLFRQYIINQCFLSIPVAPLIGILGCLLETMTDKYKLINLCKVSERHSLKFKCIITSFLFVDTLAMFFGYPNGFIWML